MDVGDRPGPWVAVRSTLLQGGSSLGFWLPCLEEVAFPACLPPGVSKAK